MLKEIKKELLDNPEKLEELLEYFNFYNIHIHQSYISFGRAIDSSKKSIAIRLEKNDYLYVSDYARNINQDLFTYISEQRLVDFKDIISIVRKILKIDDFSIFREPQGIFGGFYEKIRKKNEYTCRTYDESILNKYVALANMRFIRDNITIDAQQFFNIRYDVESQGIVNMFTFPVSTISLLRQDGKFVDEDFAVWAIKHNMEWSDSNLFVDDSVNSLSNCCRLKSNIEDLGYFNSIGGTALKVGSVKVSTINLARIALDTNSEEEYLKELEKRVYINLIALDRVRHIIRRNVEKGLLPNFTYNLVDFEHLYNTIGFIGIYETMKKFGYIKVDELGDTYYTDKASAFGKKIFETMRSTADRFIKENNCDYQINTEQIPGESAAAKLMKKDKFFYPNAKIYDLPLYGNQFIPLGIKTTGQERVRIASEFDRYCSGGSILHYNIDAPFDSFEKAWKMVNYIADQGVTYFAFNTKIQACVNNHAFYGNVCPIDGESVATEFTRIVGFYTPVRTYSKERKSEFEMRRWIDINAESERV